MKQISILITLIGLLLTGCTQKPAELQSGKWRFALELKEGIELPFLATLDQVGGGYLLKIHNDTEDILVPEITRWGDSIFIRMPIFDSEFHGKVLSSTKIQGDWYNYSRGVDYKVPFVAEQGADVRRFTSENASPSTIAPIWQADFSEGTEDWYPAIGEFEQKGTSLTGTFLTETGDYRYLEGVVEGNEVKLSTFDGDHAFLFTAKMDEEGKLEGMFYSGNHWEEPWVAEVNPDASIRPPESLTFLKEGYDKLSFSFPDLDGNPVSLDDPRFKDKVVIIQIMGSWCPNCLDETKLYTQWYNTYKEDGLEIVGLAFERSRNDMDLAIKNVSRLKSQLQIRYPILIASATDDKDAAAQTLPMLNHILSYPTSIYIGRDGEIKKIHTGFYGPGTGDHYIRFLEEYTAFLEGLLGKESMGSFAQLSP